MKKSLIMIVVLVLTSQLYATSTVQEMMTSSQILLKEKNLKNRQTKLKNRHFAWQKRKKSLIESFKARYEGETDLGEKNYYGKIREQQHAQDFYTSLKSKDDEIAQRLFHIKRELKKLKKYYISQSD